MKFKIGDVVENERHGTGIIVAIDGSSIPYHVEFNDNSTGVTKLYMQWCEENELKLKKFTKYDLKDRDIVTLRNGEQLIYLNEEFIDLNDEYNNTLVNVDYLNEDLTHEYQAKFDVIKVERASSYDTLFETNTREMTLKEIEEELGYKINIKDER